MQEQKYSLNEKIFFKSENLKIVRCKISEFTQRIRNWFNKYLAHPCFDKPAALPYTLIAVMINGPV